MQRCVCPLDIGPATCLPQFESGGALRRISDQQALRASELPNIEFVIYLLKTKICKYTRAGVLSHSSLTETDQLNDFRCGSNFNEH